VFGSDGRAPAIPVMQAKKQEIDERVHSSIRVTVLTGTNIDCRRIKHRQEYSFNAFGLSI